ncbi:hydantoinase/oxoprolinase [delta proteobacterium NaphS2]|nr:hydantoinase/oxoprolinase [delta proteobacterium NaphS2]
MRFRMSIDTGGTFTDAFSVDEKGHLVTAKVPTNPTDLHIGSRGAIEELARKNNLELREFLGQVTSLIHGTTQGTNTIITRSGPKIGLICTQGQRDTIGLRRVPRDNMWDWRKPCPEPLVPRYLRREVVERIDAKGNVLVPLDEDSVRKAVSYLKEMAVEAIVVTLLFSFLRPDHEERIGEIINEEFPGIDVTLSYTMTSELGEYERTSTAIINAYVAPDIRKYIDSATIWLKQNGFRGQFLFMQNNGGVATAEIVKAIPANLAISGPAAGPSAAIFLGNLHGNVNVLSVDMGGTSCDISIVDKQNVVTKSQSLIDEYRFSLPVVDVSAIGAGGGSIAWFDTSDTLRIGPKSAGADPGPACYGKGGEEATITDANLVLGYIDPDYFLGGKMKLRKDLAEKAVKEKVADKLGLSVTEAAAAIYKVANTVMANGVSTTFTRRGYDPRDFVLCAGGGAASLCAVRIAEELKISRVMVGKYAPVYCAFGMLAVDLKHDYSMFYHIPGDFLDVERVKAIYEKMEAEGIAVLEREGVPQSQQVLQRTVKIRYFGQFRQIEVPWPNGEITRDLINVGVANFHKKHDEMFGSSDENFPIEFYGFGLTALGKMSEIKVAKLINGGENPSQALKEERDVYFDEANGFVRTNVYDGDKMERGNIVLGPCIIEEKMTNIVIPQGVSMRVDRYGNYISGYSSSQMT